MASSVYIYRQKYFHVPKVFLLHLKFAVGFQAQLDR